MKTLRFDDLEPFLLPGNGNRIFKLPVGSEWIILKHYRGSRNGLETFRKSLSAWLAGQTSYSPGTRCRTERECLLVWRKHGFQTFRLLENCQIEAPRCSHGEYNLMWYERGPRLVDYLRDPAVQEENRIDVFRSFIREWGRRHELAIRLREPRLVHENGDIKHLKITPGGLVWFDFEITYRSAGSVEGYVAREIATYLKSVLRMLEPPLNEVLWNETLALYPAPSRLSEVKSYFFRHPNLIHRAGRWIDRNYGRRGRKPLSKYTVAERLAQAACRKDRPHRPDRT